jgi:hypothetical protein
MLRCICGRVCNKVTVSKVPAMLSFSENSPPVKRDLHCVQNDVPFLACF